MLSYRTVLITYPVVPEQDWQGATDVILEWLQKSWGEDILRRTAVADPPSIYVAYHTREKRDEALRRLDRAKPVIPGPDTVPEVIALNLSGVHGCVTWFIRARRHCICNVACAINQHFERQDINYKSSCELRKVQCSGSKVPFFAVRFEVDPPFPCRHMEVGDDIVQVCKVEKNQCCFCDSYAHTLWECEESELYSISQKCLSWCIDVCPADSVDILLPEAEVRFPPSAHLCLRLFWLS